jgi:hypothetical protein
MRDLAPPPIRIDPSLIAAAAFCSSFCIAFANVGFIVLSWQRGQVAALFPHQS